MPNIATAIKDEITRLARKELRADTQSLKTASSAHRSDIAALKRRVAELEKVLARLVKMVAKVQPVEEVQVAKHRYSAKALRTQRQRLGLSAAEFGNLVGVSAQTVYNWEAESSRPRDTQIVALGALRGVGKREARARLEAIAAQSA